MEYEYPRVNRRFAGRVNKSYPAYNGDWGKAREAAQVLFARRQKRKKPQGGAGRNRRRGAWTKPAIWTKLQPGHGDRAAPARDADFMKTLLKTST